MYQLTQMSIFILFKSVDGLFGSTFSLWVSLPLKKIFWKTKAFSKKVEDRFVVESTKIENASFPYKTVMSEANVKINRTMTTKWTYHKEASTYYSCYGKVDGKYLLFCHKIYIFGFHLLEAILK